jgi:thioredoxin-like negative regulator of GroEL
LNVKNIVPRQWLGLSATLVLVSASTGCQQKSDATTELDKAVSTMQTAAAAPQPAAAQPQSDAPAASPAQAMNRAVAAYKAGQLEDAVTQLQRLRATPTLTPQQRMALNDAIASVMSEVSTLAAKGDPRAIQALQQYGKMQNQRQ